MLDMNIIRINGYKDGKRTHVDVNVGLHTFDVNGHEIIAPRHIYDIAECGFKHGLDGVTSYNMYNWAARKRLTEKVY